MAKDSTKSIRRIALTGPESTGKTTLCIELAAHYKTVWVPEFSREYMEKLNRPYTYEDVINCTRGQMETEDMLMSKANRFLFSDNELINYKVWFEDVFKEAPDWIEAEIAKREFDLYLLTATDLPWVHEDVRENPHRREYFFDLYQKELEKRNFNYRVLTGSGASRLDAAIQFIETAF